MPWQSFRFDSRAANLQHKRRLLSQQCADSVRIRHDVVFAGKENDCSCTDSNAMKRDCCRVTAIERLKGIDGAVKILVRTQNHVRCHNVSEKRQVTEQSYDDVDDKIYSGNGP